MTFFSIKMRLLRLMSDTPQPFAFSKRQPEISQHSAPDTTMAPSTS